MTRPNSEAPKPVLVLATIQNSSLFNERATTLTDQQSELLDKVESELLRNFDVKRTTVSYQGLDVLERRFGTFWGSSLWAQLLANIQQTRHRAFVDDQVGQSWTTREKISNYGRSMAALIYKSAKPKFRKSLDRLKVIETLLSDKHIYLWTYLVEQGAQGALILEDDFAPHEDFTSGDISEVIANSVGSFDYVNLSRSFTFQKLGLPPQEEDYILDFIKTNTFCAYYISAKAAKAMIGILSHRPYLRTVGADFLLHELNRESETWKSLLPANPPIRHGTLDNRKRSTIGTAQ